MNTKVMDKNNEVTRQPLAEARGRSTSAARDLEAAILALPCVPPQYNNTHVTHAYMDGHHDARHAAALVAAHQPAQQPLTVPEGFVLVPTEAMLSAARAAERERCAQLCDERARGWDQAGPSKDDSYGLCQFGAKNEARALASAIREAAPAQPAPVGAAPATPLPQPGDAIQRATTQGMADCMDMVRSELIDAGIIDASVAPMFITEAVMDYINKVRAPPPRRVEGSIDTGKFRALAYTFALRFAKNEDRGNEALETIVAHIDARLARTAAPTSEPVAYFRAESDGTIMWGEDCCCVDPIYPTAPEDEDSEGKPVISLPVYRAAPQALPATEQPALTVWYGSMPESNGKFNFTAILTRKDAEGLDVFEGFTIARSEYLDRVRYEADCVRHLIGELAEQPWILDYDAAKHSGYVKPNVAGGAHE